MWYTKSGQLCIILGLVFRGRICVYGAKVEENGAFHAAGSVEGTLVCLSHRNRDVASEKWCRRPEIGICGGGQPGSPATLAKTSDAQPVTVNGAVAL